MNKIENEDFRNYALLAIKEYKDNKIVNLTTMRSIFDSLDIDVQLDPLDRADQMILVLLLALATR
jgi:hypothetical protein